MRAAPSRLIRWSMSHECIVEKLAGRDLKRGTGHAIDERAATRTPRRAGLWY